ncbi:hypothetical protein B0H14DRAFT_2580037, partial [Mycena olivaceomarginata]
SVRGAPDGPPDTISTSSAPLSLRQPTRRSSRVPDMHASTHRRREQHPEATHILDRLRNDLNFAAILADIALAKPRPKSSLRSSSRTTAIFPLGPQDGPSDDGKAIPASGVSRRHEAGCLQPQLQSQQHGSVCVDKQEAPEADGATGRDGGPHRNGVPRPGERQSIPFTEGAYEDTYENHMKTLADTRDLLPSRYKVLHGLFTQVTFVLPSFPLSLMFRFFSDGKSTQPEAGSSATLINLVEVDESD